MTCECEQHVFPRGLDIDAGLDALPRQLGTFADFRAAMAGELARAAPWRSWHGRDTADFGQMLLEMWAYVCDVTSFYDQVIANESYVRTAVRRSSLRKLTALIGYRPRPAVASTVKLALVASGRVPIVVPRGTGFRSGGFGDEPPQTFELDHDARVHPLLDGWPVERVRSPLVLPSSVLLVDRSTKVKRGEQLVFVVGGAPVLRSVTAAAPYTARDGDSYTKLELDAAITDSNGAGATAPQAIRVLRPGAQLDFGGRLRIDTVFASGVSLGHYTLANAIAAVQAAQASAGASPGAAPAQPSAVSAPAPAPAHARPAASFDGKRADVTKGLEVVAVFSDRSVAMATVYGVALAEPNLTTSSHSESTLDLSTDVTTTDTTISAGVTTPVTTVTFDGIRDVPVAMLYRLTEVATVTTEYKRTLDPGDPILLTAPVLSPLDGTTSSTFLLGDEEGGGALVTGGLDFDGRALRADASIPTRLAAIVQAWGNTADASRGESVPRETLGSGDALTPSPSFTLKKSPLTYLSAPAASNPIGAVNTLEVRVDGILWKEVPSFFGVGPADRVYIVRESDDGKSTVTFGDGVRGALVPAGQDNLVATYRFGAGLASPPAGSITQIATAIAGLSGVQSPIAPTGGDDADVASKLRSLAPRSALVLGRAVSIEDMQALARAQPGVRAASAEWRWDGRVQRACVRVFYIGSAREDDVTRALRVASDPTVPITCNAATPIAATLSIGLEIDVRYVESRVRAAVRAALVAPDAGLLCLERVGIGTALFESALYEAVLAVEGTVGVSGMRWNGGPFGESGAPYARRALAGTYFDLEPNLLIDGLGRYDG